MDFNPDGSLKVVEIKRELNEEDALDLISKAKEFEDKFDKLRYEKALKELKDFQVKFPINSLKDLDLKKYCEGFPDSFCCWVDKKTRNVALIAHLGFNQEFGVWFNNKEEKYYIRTTRGKLIVEEESAKSKLEEVKMNIIQVLDYAKDNKFRQIDEIKLPWHQVKMKIVYLYYPDRIIPVMSKEQIQFICNKFNVPFDELSPLDSNHDLLMRIRKIDLLKDWSTQKLSMLFYSIYSELNKMKLKE